MKRFILLGLIGVILFLTTGCGAKSEIEDLGMVAAMGIDTTPAGDYLISLQILKAQKQSSGGMGGQKGGKPETPSDVELITVSGDTIYGAFDNLSTQLGKKLHLSHINFVVISEKVAQSGVADIIDAGLRSHQFRIDTPFLVTKDKASKIIFTKTPDNPIPANAIKNILDWQSRHGYSAVITYLDFANVLASKTTAPVAGVIDRYDTELAGETITVAGLAVFNKDKLAGYLDAEETRGMQWIKGKVREGTITIPSPEKGKITLRITSASSKITPIIKNEKLVIQVKVRAQSYLRELDDQLDPMGNPGILKELDQRQNEAIKSEINNALYAAQQNLKADIFEFGQVIRRDYPSEWKSMEKNWSETFPDLEIEIIVDSHILRPGMISKPLY